MAEEDEWREKATSLALDLVSCQASRSRLFESLRLIEGTTVLARDGKRVNWKATAERLKREARFTLNREALVKKPKPA